jgi:hypothetical protein
MTTLNNEQSRVTKDHSQSQTKSDLDATAEESANQSIDPLFVYLSTKNGHEVATRVLDVVESIKKSTLDKSSKNVWVEKIIQLSSVMAVIVATTFLVYSGKFDASVGVLFGTVIGYAFGKK